MVVVGYSWVADCGCWGYPVYNCVFVSELIPLKFKYFFSKNTHPFFNLHTTTHHIKITPFFPSPFSIPKRYLQRPHIRLQHRQLLQMLNNRLPLRRRNPHVGSLTVLDQFEADLVALGLAGEVGGAHRVQHAGLLDAWQVGYGWE